MATNQQLIAERVREFKEKPISIEQAIINHACRPRLIVSEAQMEMEDEANHERDEEEARERAARDRDDVEYQQWKAGPNGRSQDFQDIVQDMTDEEIVEALFDEMKRRGECDYVSLSVGTYGWLERSVRNLADTFVNALPEPWFEWLFGKEVRK